MGRHSYVVEINGYFIFPHWEKSFRGAAKRLFCAILSFGTYS